MATTMSKYGASINRPLSEIVGLSTDVKPTDKVEGIPIQNGSTFFEMDTNKKYRFDIESRQWNLVDGGSGGGSATLIDKTITANGTYNASDDGADGYKKIEINVGATGIPKLATPITYNENAFYVLQGLYNGATFVDISNRYVSESSHPLYYVIMQPIQTIYFEYEFQGGKSGRIIFTALRDNINIKCYYGSSVIDVTYDEESSIKKGDFKQGKTYYVSYWTVSRGSSTMYDTIVNVTEYDEPITFTLE